MLDVLKSVRCMLLCILEAVEVMLEVLEGMRLILGAVKDVRRVLKVLEVVNDVRRLLCVRVMLCMLFSILDAVEGELHLLEVLE